MEPAASPHSSANASQRRRRQEFLGRVEAFSKDVLAAKLGLAGSPVHVAAARHGYRSLVYFVDFGEEQQCVVRALKKPTDAWFLSGNLRRLAQLGLPVPQLLRASLSPVTRWRWGFFPLVEERILGAHVDELGHSEEAVRAVAATLARFHAVQRARWGRLRWPRLGSYRRYYLKRAAGRVAHVEDVLAFPCGEALQSWFAEHVPAQTLAPPFSLLHGMAHRRNFIVSSGVAYAIDLLECRFGCFAEELAAALARICLGEEEETAWFLESYFATAGEERRGEFEATRHFFHAAHELSRASIYSRRWRRRCVAGKPAGAIRASLELHVSRLAAATGIDMEVREECP